MRETFLKTLRKRRLLLKRIDELTSLADLSGSDKGTLFDAHGYTRVYSKLFAPFRGRGIVLLEIGLHRPEADFRRQGNAVEGATQYAAQRAPSLEMWRTFFPFAKIFGFDIDDFSAVRIERCTVLRGDMSSSLDLERLLTTIGEPIDIVIDDASHASHHQQIALGHIFPRLRSGGLYIIEDLCWQDEYLEREGVAKTRDLLRELQINRVFKSTVISIEQRRALENEVKEVRLYDSLTTRISDGTDSLGVLVKA